MKTYSQLKKWPIIVAVAMLVGTWGMLRSLSHGELVVAKKPFAEFPLMIAERWQGKEFGLEPEILDTLKLTDYMMRVYVPLTPHAARLSSPKSSPLTPHPSRLTPYGSPVWLYVGYYQSQRTGTTYHSPQNCLPGAGWQFVEADHVAVPVPGRGSITINRVLVQKGLDRQLILYWYHDRGRVIASEYWAKGYLIWDAMTKNRTDGALVRISMPVATSTEEVYQHSLAFLQDLWPVLQDYMPSGEKVL